MLHWLGANHNLATGFLSQHSDFDYTLIDNSNSINGIIIGGRSIGHNRKVAMRIQLIITHPGSAHFDEVAAISLIMAMHTDTEFRIERREPTQIELDNPDVWVVDIGNRHEPEKHNFTITRIRTARLRLFWWPNTWNFRRLCPSCLGGNLRTAWTASGR